MKKVILCYVPVPHFGFKELFDRHPSIDVLLISKEFVLQFKPELTERIQRMFNALPASDTEIMLRAYLSCRNVMVISSLEDLKRFDEVIIPRGDYCDLFGPIIIKMGIRVNIESQFLMWDWSAIQSKKAVAVETETTTCVLHRELMNQALVDAEKSSDWWRHVGALLSTKNGTNIVAFNEHQPSEHSPYINGDIRVNFNAGQSPEIGTSIHAELSTITSAARLGHATDHATMYVTTYPCHNCARAIKNAGIKTVYFKDGYSSLDAKEVFDEAGIRVVKVLYS